MDFKEVDWDSITPNLGKAESTRLQSGSVPERSYWILKAAAGAKNQSIANLVASLVNAQVRRWEESWYEDIKFLAARNNLTFEEAFVKLATGQPLSNNPTE